MDITVIAPSFGPQWPFHLLVEEVLQLIEFKASRIIIST